MAKKPVKKTEQKEMCPACGNKRMPDDAHVYECPECGKNGFDCCVPGSNTLCWECDEPEDD